MVVSEEHPVKVSGLIIVKLSGRTILVRALHPLKFTVVTPSGMSTCCKREQSTRENDFNPFGKVMLFKEVQAYRSKLVTLSGITRLSIGALDRYRYSSLSGISIVFNA
jgi:hypothetical protein